MKEYGGFLPLELNINKEHYSEEEFPVLKVNSGRTAIYCALKALSPQFIYVPHYICDTVYDVIERLNIPMKKYFISEQLKPQISIEDEGCILVVNYFGMLDSYIQELAQTWKNIIVDNTQAFFSKPIIRKGIYNVYSCRKFIGVSDGAYLIAEEIKSTDYHLKTEYSGEYSEHLMVSYEKGTNCVYSQNIWNESRLKDNLSYMSPLTRAILSGVNYENIIRARTYNWRFLQAKLGEINLLSGLTENIVPGYAYPFLVSESIREKLIDRKVYVSCLWKELLKEEYEGTNEYFFSKYLIPLPIDQRYGRDDMEELCKIVLRTLEYSDEVG